MLVCWAVVMAFFRLTWCVWGGVALSSWVLSRQSRVGAYGNVADFNFSVFFSVFPSLENRSGPFCTATVPSTLAGVGDW